MKTYSKQVELLNEKAVVLGNGELEVTIIPALGSNLLSIKDLRNNEELLRVPASRQEFDDNNVLFGTPILFPPNRISDGVFSFKERKYRFDLTEPNLNNHIHGLVHEAEWLVKEITEVEGEIALHTLFDSRDHEEALRQFPHYFTIEMIYTLNGTTLSKEAIITNQGDEEFPWGIGFHTSFLLNEKEDQFSLTAHKKWRLDDRNLPLGALETLTEKEEKLPSTPAYVGVQLLLPSHLRNSTNTLHHFAFEDRIKTLNKQLKIVVHQTNRTHFEVHTLSLL